MKWYRWNPNTSVLYLSSGVLGPINFVYGKDPTKGTIHSPYYGISVQGAVGNKRAYFQHTDGNVSHDRLGLVDGGYIGFPDAIPDSFAPLPTPTEKENTKIKGRYEPKQKFPTTLDSKSTGCFTINFSYKLDNQLYNGVHLNISGNGRVTAYTPDKSPNSDVIVDITGPVSGFEYIDFGDMEQDIPLEIYNWLMENFSLPKKAKITIYNNSGDTILAESELLEDVDTLALARIGNQITLLTNNNESLTWTASEPDKHFTGLTTVKNGVTVRILSGKVTSFSVREPLALYEIYGKAEEEPTTFVMHFYTNTAENNRVDKTNFLTSTITLNGVLRESCSIMAPAFNIEVKKVSDVLNSNYVYIPAFRRYYFITDITSLYKNIWRVSCSCDVLMSFKDSIYQLEGIIGRNENEYNDMIPDNEIVTELGVEREFIDLYTAAFETQSNTDRYLVTIVGADVDQVLPDPPEND